MISRLAILDVIRENFYLLYKIVTKGLLFLCGCFTLLKQLNKDKHSNSVKNKKPRTFVGALFSLNGNYFLSI